MFGGATDRSSGGGSAWRALAASALLALALLLAGAASARAQDPAPVKVLLFHGTPGDETTQPGIDAFEAIAEGNGFTVDATGDASQISAAGLEPYRAIVFLNTAGDLLDDEQEGALEAFIEDGGGFLGIGSAARVRGRDGVLRRADRRAPERGELDDAVGAARRRRRSRASGDEGPAARDRPDRRLVPVADPADRDGAHRRALPRDERARG